MSKCGLSFISFSLLFPPLLVPRSISLTNIDWWRQVGVEQCAWVMEVSAPLHSLLPSASIDFFWGANSIYSLHTSLLWIITTCTDGLLPGSTGKIELSACSNAQQNLLINTFAGWIVVYIHTPSCTSNRPDTHVWSFPSNALKPHAGKLLIVTCHQTVQHVITPLYYL